MLKVTCNLNNFLKECNVCIKCIVCLCDFVFSPPHPPPTHSFVTVDCQTQTCASYQR